MVNFLLDYILETREQMKYPITMLLDEFTNFGKISGIGDTLSIIRKNKIGLILGFQNYFQLEQVYSRREAQIIIDMPATQVYFKQKTFTEARELSEAIGRTTVEEATVNDNGRVHEMIQGRALITPDELIGLKNEVIIFAPDTNPLKLPLTSPTAYDQALQYDPPDRDKHKVSDFVRKRGRTQNRVEEEEPEQHSQRKKKPWRNDKSQKQRRSDQNKKRTTSNETENRNTEPKPSRHDDENPSDGNPPDYAD
jgi:type IV secretory pathway TraG/TraD family ATPase VirD4